MATGTVVLLDDPVITLAGNDIADQVTQLTMPMSANMLDVTTFASAGWTESRPGLKSSSISMNAFNEDGTNTITTLLRTAFLAGSPLALVLKADGAGTSATNPQYTWSVYVESFEPISGSVGENNTTTLALRATGAPTVATS
jgi:hypothetical protein